MVEGKSQYGPAHGDADTSPTDRAHQPRTGINGAEVRKGIAFERLDTNEYALVFDGEVEAPR